MQWSYTVGLLCERQHDKSIGVSTTAVADVVVIIVVVVVVVSCTRGMAVSYIACFGICEWMRWWHSIATSFNHFTQSMCLCVDIYMWQRAYTIQSVKIRNTRQYYCSLIPRHTLSGAFSSLFFYNVRYRTKILEANSLRYGFVSNVVFHFQDANAVLIAYKLKGKKTPR